MKYAKMFAAFGLGIATTALVSAALPAQEEAGGRAVEASAMDDMSMKATKPGPMHRRLAPLVGKWHMQVKYRMAPDGEWMESTADATREWMYDGRFLAEKVHGEMPMGPFEGMALMGYDNVREQYVSVWIDNTSTGIHVGTGAALDRENVIETEGMTSNSMTGEKEQWFRDRVEIKSNDENLYQSFHKGPDGREYMAMEIVCTRK